MTTIDCHSKCFWQENHVCTKREVTMIKSQCGMICADEALLTESTDIDSPKIIPPEPPIQTTFGLIPQMPKTVSTTPLVIVAGNNGQGIIPVYFRMPHQLYEEQLKSLYKQFRHLSIYGCQLLADVLCEGQKLWLVKPKEARPHDY